MKQFLFLAGIVLSLTIQVQAQKKKASEATPVTPARSAIEVKTDGLKKFEGYLNFYFDEKQDKIFLEIERYNEELLYLESLTAAIGSNDIGLDRNQLGKERVVKFDRRGPKVLMTEMNYGYRALSNNPAERLAVEQAFAQSVIWGFPVVAEADGKVLVDATDFLLQDMHDVAGRLRATQQGNYGLDRSRSALYAPAIKNFPSNTEFESTLTFTGEAKGSYIASVAPSPNSVTVREHHSFIRLPDVGYKPRIFDPRAGYFTGITYFDYATPISEPINKLMMPRHRLQKKNPSAEVSEAVKPIVYYLDPGTPEPIRSALLDGARWWDQAFEAAGYQHAFRVEMLPEGADPMDIRYNMINWVHRSTRGWSYGATVTDPRTGEIIKGHVTLGSLRVRQDFLIAEGLLAPYETGKPASKEMEAMAIARLRQLSAHEVGHTLGLAHAYSSSAEGRSSVMDYPHPLIKMKDGRIDLSEAYDDKIGAFDKLSIEFGYQDFPEGTNEKQALEDIIQRGLKQGLSFLSDQDARPAGSTHPYTHLWDNGTDPADELNRMMDIRSVVLKNFGEKNIRTGAPMAMLEEVLVPMYFMHRYQTEAASKVVGGLDYRYAMRGDGQPVTKLLDPSWQLKALDALLRTTQPASLKLPESLLSQIPPRPLGYYRHRELIKTKTDLAFDPLSLAETAADLTFSLLLHPARANRIFEHHARDSRQPSLEVVLDKIIQSAFRQDGNGMDAAVQMSTATAALSNLTTLAASPEASSPVKGLVMLKLEKLKAGMIKNQAVMNSEWSGFSTWCIGVINQLREHPQDFKPADILPAPPGQPIGTTETFCSWGSTN